MAVEGLRNKTRFRLQSLAWVYTTLACEAVSRRKSETTEVCLKFVFESRTMFQRKKSRLVCKLWTRLNGFGALKFADSGSLTSLVLRANDKV
jgi:hypothetical protein